MAAEGQVASGEKDYAPDPEDVARFEFASSTPRPLSAPFAPQPRLSPRETAFKELGREFLMARERSRVRLRDAWKVIGIEPSIINKIDRGDFGSFKDDAKLRGDILTYSLFLGLDTVDIMTKYNTAIALPDVPDWRRRTP
jgi:hypothetical protein